jgi:predicted lipoprotein with Yx(FWY)xxD motif
MRPRASIVVVAAGAAFAVAGCGSGGSGSASTAAAAGGSAAYGKDAVSTAVQVAKARRATVGTRRTRLGTFLVDGRGRTLYLFEKDRGHKSRCYGRCAQAWPPLTSAGRPRAKGRAKASELSTVARRGGGRQVAYDGHPLYLFVGDAKAGQTKGQGSHAFGAGWYVVAPSGEEIDDD